jgi:hypothetical protein
VLIPAAVAFPVATVVTPAGGVFPVAARDVPGWRAGARSDAPVAVAGVANRMKAAIATNVPATAHRDLILPTSLR